MTGFREVILVLTVVTTGLSAGLLATFAYAVIPGLNRAEPRAAVPVMQQVNEVIVNPLFLFIFFGDLILGALGIWLYRDHALRWYLVAAVVLILAGILITITVNVPANGRLADAGPVDDQSAARVWSEFVGVWVRWNIIRAILTTGALATLVVGILRTRG